jgi:cell wall-associated NlpC family hydrolase
VSKSLRSAAYWAQLALVCLTLFGCANVAPRPNTPTGPVREPVQAHAVTVAFRALSLVGTPYVYGGESPATGFDCSGFVRFIYRDAIGVTLARTAAAQAQTGARIAQVEQLRLGDLVFFADDGKVFHVGLYVGEGRFVHAPRTGKNVQLSELNVSGYWRQRFAGGRRVL